MIYGQTEPACAITVLKTHTLEKFRSGNETHERARSEGGLNVQLGDLPKAEEVDMKDYLGHAASAIILVTAVPV